MSLSFLAPGPGEGPSSGSDPTHPPRKKRARVDPTVESVCLPLSYVEVRAHCTVLCLFVLCWERGSTVGCLV